MVHQLFVRVHFVVVAKALALAAKVCLDIHQICDIIVRVAGASWIFGNQGKRMNGNSKIRSWVP